MSHARASTIPWVLGGLFCLLLPACGGGAAPPPSTPLDAFLGTYFHQSWAGDPGPADLQTAVWGTFDTDGLGMVTGGVETENSGGTVFGPAAVTPLPYAISPGRRLTFTHGGLTMEGGLTADGAAAILGSVGTTNRPALAILGRREGTHDVGSLTGSYHLCGYFNDGTRDIAWWGGTATFDGAGNAEARTGSTMDGVATPPDPLPVSFGTYSVATDGNVQWVTSEGTFQGGILLGGELVVLSGMTVGGVQGILVLVQQGRSLSNATFDGPYHMVWLLSGLDLGPLRYGSVTGAATSDGAGMWSQEGVTENIGGEIDSEPASDTSYPYSVSPNGAISLYSGQLLGGVSPSGRVAVVAGGTTAMGTVVDVETLYVFLR